MTTGSSTVTGMLARLWSRPRSRVGLIVLVAGLTIVVSITVFMLLNADFRDVERWKSLGYPGVFLLSLLGSAAMIPLVPGIVSLCGVSALLNPFLLGVLNALGETAGEASSYAIGYGGSPVLERRRFYRRVKLWMERRGAVALFVVSAIPNPIFDIVGIAAGGIRFPFKKFILLVLAGKLIKGLAVAYACSYGADAIIGFLPWV